MATRKWISSQELLWSQPWQNLVSSPNILAISKFSCIFTSVGNIGTFWRIYTHSEFFYYILLFIILCSNVEVIALPARFCLLANLPSHVWPKFLVSFIWSWRDIRVASWYMNLFALTYYYVISCCVLYLSRTQTEIFARKRTANYVVKYQIPITDWLTIRISDTVWLSRCANGIRDLRESEMGKQREFEYPEQLLSSQQLLAT